MFSAKEKFLGLLVIFFLILGLGLFQIVPKITEAWNNGTSDGTNGDNLGLGVTKAIGETAEITVYCSDSNGNLTQCNITSPISKTCVVGGSSGSCSGTFTCQNAGTYNVCGKAVDDRGETNEKCLERIVCNGRPQAGNRGETWDYCAWGKTPQVAAGLAVIFNWTYSDPEGDPQTAYEIWVDDNPNFPDPKFNNLVTLSPSPGPDFSYALNLADDDNSDWVSQLNWNTTYYWKVRVKDSQGNWSDWSSTDSFTTPLHAHPFINFNWIPEKPSVKELVYFTDQSEVFGGTTKSSWYWTFQDGNPSSSNLQNATTTFTSIGSKTVSLRVTDSDGYSCSGSKTVQTTLPLPEWREISPF